jgi:uncharacterized protein YbjT (DUF2867 family)
MMVDRIAVIGATGNVGVEVVKNLHARGAPVVAAVRNIPKARRLLGNNISYVEFDFARPETFVDAFINVRKLFLVRPPDIADTQRYIAPALTAARAAGVEHVVFLSLLGVERNRFVPHYAIEQELLKSGMDWTFLRASFFMQNLNTVHRADIRDGNVIFLPAGYGKTSFIDVRDIAAVGAKALTEDGHRNKAYPLTGDVALSYGDTVDIFSQVLARPIRYHNSSVIAFAARMRARGYPWSFVLVMIGIYTTARLGLAARVTPDTEHLLGRTPISFRQYVADYRRCWL